MLKESLPQPLIDPNRKGKQKRGKKCYLIFSLKYYSCGGTLYYMFNCLVLEVFISIGNLKWMINNVFSILIYLFYFDLV